VSSNALRASLKARFSAAVLASARDPAPTSQSTVSNRRTVLVIGQTLSQNASGLKGRK